MPMLLTREVLDHNKSGATRSEKAIGNSMVPMIIWGESLDSYKTTDFKLCTELDPDGRLVQLSKELMP